jgi:hypothetical protein
MDRDVTISPIVTVIISIQIKKGASQNPAPVHENRKNVDGKTEMKLSSMKKAENVDEKMQTRPPIHEKARNINALAICKNFAYFLHLRLEVE